jgi:hypothetical protein
MEVPRKLQGVDGSIRAKTLIKGVILADTSPVDAALARTMGSGRC